MIHEVQVERGRAGFRACCASCMWTGFWGSLRERATLEAIEHQLHTATAA